MQISLLGIIATIIIMMLLSVGRRYFTILVTPPKAFTFKEGLPERFAVVIVMYSKLGQPCLSDFINSSPEYVSVLHLEKMNRIQRSKPQAPTTFSPAHALTWGQSRRLNVTLEIKILPPQKRDKLGSAFQEAYEEPRILEEVQMKESQVS